MSAQLSRMVAGGEFARCSERTRKALAELIGYLRETEAAPPASSSVVGAFDLSLIPDDLTGQWLTWLFEDKHKARAEQREPEQFDKTSVCAIVYWWEKYKRPGIVTGAAPVEASAGVATDFDPLVQLPGEYELGRIIRDAVDYDPANERMFLICSVGELAQRIAHVFAKRT